MELEMGERGSTAMMTCGRSITPAMAFNSRHRFCFSKGQQRIQMETQQQCLT
ncbi:hypothetical protein HanXRQr2_Chr10g0454861 [Helianthus annuus]|uniref:Uncharacterized protein n=1 Tax=Helianthus annuus TaxID=4232 RepID=A0A9K3I0K4_HELAN|nr:hypothetical protein HanXRQr2_Chr10g0454861 [Helianthus annuus]KAJ0884907.1 hypothetical protein HanPSC8_Chr10g0439261 [Helianthus annuus]